MTTFQPLYTTAAAVFQNEYFEIYAISSGNQYFKLYAAPSNQWGFPPTQGGYIGVPNGGSLFTLFLNNDQIQAFANALRLHLSTGLINTTINGVSVVTTGDGVNVTVNAISYTTSFSNDEARKLADAAAHYAVTLL